VGDDDGDQGDEEPGAVATTATTTSLLCLLSAWRTLGRFSKAAISVAGKRDLWPYAS